MLAGGVISWRSAKHALIASSTMAAEFIAYYEASNHGIWLRNFVIGLSVVKGIERPLKIYCDNNSAVLYLTTEALQSRNTLTSSFLLLKKEFRMASCLSSTLGQIL